MVYSSLQVLPDAVADAVGDEDAVPGADAGLRVLCVDDEPRILAGLDLQLGRRWKVLTATSGAEGLEILRREPNVAVIISDMRMPGMDGSAFLRQARELAPDTTRMLLTGQADIESAMAAINQGQVFRFLLKPFPPQALIATVAAAAAQYRVVAAQRVLMEQATAGRAQHADPQTELRSIFAKACALFGCRYAAMGWSEDRADAEVEVLTYRLAPALFANANPHRAPAMLSGFARGNEVHWRADAGPAQAEALPAGHPPVSEALGVPLATASACYGWMYFADSKRDAIFAADDVQAASTLAAAIARVCEAQIARRLRARAGDDGRPISLSSGDPLTGLANRQELLERTAGLLQTADGGRVAMLVLNLERFKHINDRLGYETGDEILKQVAERLRELAAPSGFAARIGGDSFAVALSVATDDTDLSRLNSALCQPLDQPLLVAGQSLQLSARLGLSVFPEDAAAAEGLLRNAELAMNSARAAAEPLRRYTSALGADTSRRMKLEEGLLRAVGLMQFRLCYQPKVSLHDDTLCGAEALLRWDSPELGPVPPSEFVPLLEASGLIVEVGRWVLQRAVADWRRWREEGLNPPPIAVNVSPVQLRRPDFVDDLRRVLADGDAVAGITLELTESTLLNTTGDVIETLRRIRDLGVAIAIDDFGTGYSALSYLAQLPISTIKIDRSFIVALRDSADTHAIVAAIISLAHALKLQVVAEGVDAVDQLKVLRQLACDEFQGYLASRPLAPEDFAALMRRKERFVLA